MARLKASEYRAVARVLERLIPPIHMSLDRQIRMGSDGPRDGDVNDDGLVFHNHRWRRKEDVPAVAKSGGKKVDMQSRMLRADLDPLDSKTLDAIRKQHNDSGTRRTAKKLLKERGEKIIGPGKVEGGRTDKPRGIPKESPEESEKRERLEDAAYDSVLKLSDELTKRGAKKTYQSSSGSEYFELPDGRTVRVSDHTIPQNQWRDFTGSAERWDEQIVFSGRAEPTKAVAAAIDRLFGSDEADTETSTPVTKWASKRFKDPAHAKAFVKWFGDSKVVDDDGEPRIIYTGQPRRKEEFDGSERNELPFGIGFFTTDRDVAAKYAGSHPDERGTNRRVSPSEYGVDVDLSPKHEKMLWNAAGGEDAFNDLDLDEHAALVSKVIPAEQLPATEREGKVTGFSLGKRGRTYRVFAKIEKPLDGDRFNDKEWREALEISGSDDEQIEKIAELTGIEPVYDDDSGDVIAWDTRNGSQVNDLNDLEDILRSMWSDRAGSGDYLQDAIADAPTAIACVLFPEAAEKLIAKHGYDGLTFSDAEMGGTTIVPFDGAQVKSATNNVGTFDPDNPTITMSKEAKAWQP